MQNVEFTVQMNQNRPSQSKRVRALNAQVLCAYVDVVSVVDLNSKLQIECIRILYVCMYVCYKLEVSFWIHGGMWFDGSHDFQITKLNVNSQFSNDSDDFLIYHQRVTWLGRSWLQQNKHHRFCLSVYFLSYILCNIQSFWYSIVFGMQMFSFIQGALIPITGIVCFHLLWQMFGKGPSLVLEASFIRKQ